MIDSTSGKIELLGYEISSNLTRAYFLNSLLSQDAKSVVENPPYYSYSLSDSFSEKFTISLRFDGDNLVLVELQLRMPTDDGGWGDWSEENEKHRQLEQNRWLDSNIGKQRRFPWGTVESHYDSKGGYSSILFKYETSV